MKDSPIRLGITLLLIAGIMGLILGGAYTLTKDTIDEKKDAANKDAYAQVLPDADIRNLEELPVDEAYAGRILEVYSAREGGYALRVSSKGYGGAVIIAVGLNPDGVITGVKVVEHSETPGLGANAAKEDFSGQYTGKTGELSVVKGAAGEGQISAISGATITSRSVTESVNTALQYYRDVLKGGD